MKDKMENIKTKVLLVEDDKIDQMAFQRFVKDENLLYDYTIASSVAETKKMLDSGRFDIVIADYSLGDGTAFDIFDSKTDTPIIFVTGGGDEEAAVRAMKAGAYDYIIKDSNRNYLKVLPVTVENAIKHRRAEEQFRMLSHAVMSINDSVYITDRDDKIIFVNKAFCKTYGYSEGEVLGKQSNILWNGGCFDKDKEAENTSPRAVEGGLKGEYYNKRKDGGEFPISLSRAVIRDEKGNEVAVVGIAQDITERKRAEEKIKASLKEKEVLLREIHHRVKNNMQVISSLLSLQSENIKSKKALEVIRESRYRIRTMALVHEKLYRSQDLAQIDFAGYIKDLVSGLYRLYKVDPKKIVLDVVVKDVLLGIDLAIPCGLIVNELVSNCLKYAFSLDRDGRGRIRIALRQKEGNEIELIVSDNGVGLPEDLDIRKTESLGLHLVTILAEDQLGGEITLDRRRGTKFRIEFKRLDA